MAKARAGNACNACVMRCLTRARVRVRAGEAFEGMDAVDSMKWGTLTTMMRRRMRAKRNFQFDFSTT
jgi:hypothetical protein